MNNEGKQLILIRHGVTDWNISGRRNSFTDTSINEQGIHEVKKLANYLKSSFPRADLWSSPAKQAQETAAIISDSLDTRIRTIQDAREVNYGRFEGKTPEELEVEPEAEYYKAWENGEAVEGVESLEDAALRAKHVFNEIIEQNTAEQVILVSHGVFIRVLICAVAIQAPPTSYPNLLIENASICMLRIWPDRIRLSQLNNKCYLLPERR